MTEIDIFSESFVEVQGTQIPESDDGTEPILTEIALHVYTHPEKCLIYIHETGGFERTIGKWEGYTHIPCHVSCGAPGTWGGFKSFSPLHVGKRYSVTATRAGYRSQTAYLDVKEEKDPFYMGVRLTREITFCLERGEDDDIEYPTLPFEPDIEYDSPVLNDNIAIGVPIDAFRVLLGSYTFTYGAKDNIAVTTSQVIVEFPVVNRNGTLKQTTGGGDTEYKWSGHIRVKNVHTDLDAIKKIEHLGEPVDFYYMNQKKKVLVRSFDYDILDNCNATYQIRVVEYYPQKIKAFPVRIDPLIPDRWGILPPLPPGGGSGIDDPFDRPECKCPLNIVMRGEETRVRGSLLRGKSTPWPDGINPIVSQLEKLIEDRTTWFETTFGFGFTNHEILKRILDYITKLLLSTLDIGTLACLAYLFQKCPEKQEEFFKNIVFEVFAKYAWVEAFDTFVPGKKKKYSFMRINSSGNPEGGNKGSKVLREERVFATLNECVVSLLPPYDAYVIGSSIDWRKVLESLDSCHNFAENYVVYSESCINSTVINQCQTYHALQLEPDDFAPVDLTIDEVIRILVDDDWRYHGELVIAGVALEIGCKDWCNKNVKEYMP